MFVDTFEHIYTRYKSSHSGEIYESVLMMCEYKFKVHSQVDK